MTLSELKIIVDEAIEFFTEDLEVKIYGEDGAEFEPMHIARRSGENETFFD